MAKKALMDIVREHTGCTHVVARETTSALIAAMTKELKSTGRFVLTNFGVFTVSRMKARKGRNPRTGEQIKIKASKTVRFRASRNLREAI